PAEPRREFRGTRAPNLTSCLERFQLLSSHEASNLLEPRRTRRSHSITTPIFRLKSAWFSSIAQENTTPAFLQRHGTGTCGYEKELLRFERIPVLRLHRRGNITPHRNRIHGRAFPKPLQHGHLRRQHVAVVHRGDG